MSSWGSRETKAAPIDRAGDRAEPADDDHGEVLEGEDHAEVLGHGPLEDQGEQHAGEARVHRGQDEDGGAVAGHGHAHDPGGDAVVADGVHGPAGAAAQDAAGEQRAAERGRAVPTYQSFSADPNGTSATRSLAVVEGEAEERAAAPRGR